MSDNQITQRLEEIKARAAAATPGPWKLHSRLVRDERGTEIAWAAERYLPLEQDNNGTFIAHARADIPWLVAEVERLQPPAMANRINELLEDRRKQDAYIARLEARLRDTLVDEYAANQEPLPWTLADAEAYVDAEMAKLRKE